LVAADPFFDTRSARIASLALNRKLPGIYQFREYALAGGLLSYGVKLADAYYQFGIYAGPAMPQHWYGQLVSVQRRQYANR
jgi:putative ABC transport system substrate-binding protein